MLKYLNTQITFSEFPDEITLCINITGCPNRCPGCHSPELWENIGDDLDKDILLDLISKNKGITCIGFMGGDQDPSEVNKLAKIVRKHYPSLMIGWYSGLPEISGKVDCKNFNYIKIGPYIKEKGPINKSTTNQRMIKFHHKNIVGSPTASDITDMFWKNENK